MIELIILTIPYFLLNIKDSFDFKTVVLINFTTHFSFSNYLNFLLMAFLKAIRSKKY